MSRHQDEQDELKKEEYEEPPLEDFLFEEEEEDPVQEEQKKKRRRFIIRSIAIGISLLLIVNVLSIWLNVFSLDSIKLLRGTEQYSEDEMVQESMDSVVLIQNQQSRGTGFVVHSDGLIISNDHVVDGAGPLAVTLPSGEQYVATILDSDEELDLALLEIDANDLPYLSLSEREADREERILVIGNPLLQQQIVNEGTVLEQTEGFEVLRISAPIYGGHSGSPVLTEDGEVMGVVYARTVPGLFENEPSRGLAVPIEKVKERFGDQLNR
ncbi:serine protease [Alkalihalophilus sp. As8PL]|uniref:Serine protease n=1 Tax=Alkalihalophilus sp. As8PL TaxID=3237103 RepID=A0AB39BT18_9BACI